MLPFCTILSFNHSNIRLKSVSHKKNRDCSLHNNYFTTTTITTTTSGGVTSNTITTTSNSIEVPVVVLVVVLVETISSMNFLSQQQIDKVNDI